jgi:CDP-diacylglycerol--glycerol-3-phosphate 3-phosphatidyltransferase
MITIYKLKSRFQDMLRPFVRVLARRGVTANQVTLAALLLSVVTGGCMAVFADMRWPWLLLPVVMFLRMALNAVDGMLAREHGMKTQLGALLNELADVLSDIALYLPFIFLAGAHGWLIALVVALAVTSEMTGVIAVQIGATRRYDGPMGKSDRAFVFGAAGLAAGLGFAVGPWLHWLAAILAVLLIWTIINRAQQALKECHG